MAPESDNLIVQFLFGKSSKNKKEFFWIVGSEYNKMRMNKT